MRHVTKLGAWLLSAAVLATAAGMAGADVPRLIVRLFADRSSLRGPLAAGPHTLAWPGTDARGNPVPAGVYFYRLDADGESATRKLMWLR